MDFYKCYKEYKATETNLPWRFYLKMHIISVFFVNYSFKLLQFLTDNVEILL